MKFTAEKSVLLKALSHVQSAVEKRGTIPVLSNVRLEAGKDGLLLTATDMEIAITESVPVSIKNPGDSTLPAQMLYDIVRKLPEGSQVEIASDEKNPSQMTVKSGRSRFSLMSLPSEDFPSFDQGEMDNSFSLSAEDLGSLLDKVRVAMSAEESRFYLSGIYLHVLGGADGAQELRSVSTDGHRLARVTLPVPDGASGMPGVIIPRKTVNELKKLLSEHSGDVSVSLSSSKIRFDLGGMSVVSKLIDGNFPDYERVIPKDNDKVMEVSAKALIEAVDRVSTVSTERARTVRFVISGGNVSVSVQSPDGATASEDLEANYSAGTIETGFNFRYVLDILSQIESDTVQMIFSDGSSPALIRDPSDVSVVYVMMPMRF